MYVLYAHDLEYDIVFFSAAAAVAVLFEGYDRTIT